MRRHLTQAFLTCSLLACTANAEVGDFGGTIEVGAGIFDSDAIPFYGGSIGLSYESPLGRHYLMLGGGFATQDEASSTFNDPFSSGRTAADVSLFNVGYRHGFILSDKFEPYIELGYGQASSNTTGTDVFGNPVDLDRDAGYFYSTVGISYRIYHNLHLTGSVTYLALGNDSPFGEHRSDVFGNPIFEKEDINFLARLGLSFRF